MAGPSCLYTDMDVCINDQAFVSVEAELLGGLGSDLLASTSMADVFAEYDALAFTTPDLSLSASSDDLLGAGDVVVSSKGCTAAAADALRSCGSQWQTAVSTMVTGTWTSSTSTSSAASKDDTMTDGEGAEQQRPRTAVPVANTTPRSIRKVRGRRTNKQRSATPPHAADAAREASTAAAAAAAAPAKPSAAAVVALVAATPLPESTDQQAGQDLATMSGVLRPFDAVKDYRTSGTMTLQQLNARIRGSCFLL